MNKSKTIWALVFLISSWVIQIVAFNMSSVLSVNVFCIIAMSSAVPFAVSMCIFSSIIQQKYKIFKLILTVFAAVSVVLFIIGCIIALTKGFVLVDDVYISNR